MNARPQRATTMVIDIKSEIKENPTTKKIDLSIPQSLFSKVLHKRVVIIRRLFVKIEHGGKLNFTLRVLTQNSDGISR